MGMRVKWRSICNCNFMHPALSCCTLLCWQVDSALAADGKSGLASVSEVSDDDGGEVASSDPSAGLMPNMPKDFQIYLNLVELCR